MLRRGKLILSFLLVASSAFLSAMILPYQTISQELHPGEKKVAAFYYGWWSNTTNYSQSVPYEIEDNEEWRHWNNLDRGWYPPTNVCSPNTPMQGYYDSSDPTLIETHLRQAEWAGIDAFVASYWGANGFEMKNFNTMLEVAKQINSNVSLALYFEIFMGGLDKLPEDEAVASLETEFSAIYSTMMAAENQNVVWLEDGKPVLFVYVVQAITSNIWGRVMKNLADKDMDFFLMGDRPGIGEDYNQYFQAVHQYDAYAPTRDDNYHETFFSMKQSCKKFDQIFAAAVAPAYNDTVVRDGNDPFGREDGDFYKARWNDAIALNPDWITITSWNEWHEGTEIEPSQENGDLALTQTKAFIEEFKSGEYVVLTPTPYYMDMITYAGWSIGLAWVVGLILIKREPRFKIYDDVHPIVRYPIKLLGWVGFLLGWVALGYFIYDGFIVGNYIKNLFSPYLFLIPLLTLFQFRHIGKVRRLPI